MLILHCVLEGRRHHMLILHCVSQETDQSEDMWGDLARRCQNSRKRPDAKSLIKSFVKCCAKHDFRPREAQGPFSRSRERAPRGAERRFWRDCQQKQRRTQQNARYCQRKQRPKTQNIRFRSRLSAKAAPDLAKHTRLSAKTAIGDTKHTIPLETVSKSSHRERRRRRKNIGFQPDCQ